MLGILIQVKGEMSQLSERDVRDILNAMRARKVEQRTVRPYASMTNSQHATVLYSTLYAAHYLAFPFPLSIFFKYSEGMLFAPIIFSGQLLQLCSTKPKPSSFLDALSK